MGVDQKQLDVALNTIESGITFLPEWFIRECAEQFLKDKWQERERRRTLAAERKAFKSVASEDLERRKAEGLRDNLSTTRRDYAALYTPELLDRKFTVREGGETVRWGEATASQHLERISDLDKRAQGITDTADRHRRAARDLQEAGATTLYELVS